MKTMTQRFQRSRWSPVRKWIDSMPVSMLSMFKPSQYFNCKSTVDRLNDAYDGQRRYVLKVRDGRPSVFRMR